VEDRKSGGLSVFLKAIGPILAIATLAWGVWTYKDASSRELAAMELDATRTAETRRIEAVKPFLNKQLKLFTEVTKVTAVLSTSGDPREIVAARKQFALLFFGELALVERDNVASAMLAFRNALNSGKPQDELSILSLKLAHACRDELSEAWGIDEWLRREK